jgi:predicted helicase
MVSIASKHIDSSMSAPQRDELLAWIKADVEDGNCKILTNVRCLEVLTCHLLMCFIHFCQKFSG